MLGIVRCDDELFVNHVYLVAKQYLYYCRQKRFLPSISVLDSKIKMIYQLETIVAKSNNKMSAYNIKWHTCQLSRIIRESPGYGTNLPVSRTGH